MRSHAAFLRGVNLGRNRRASSAQLKEAFEEMGFDQVAPFRTSGNVAFAAGKLAAGHLTKRVEQGLAKALGFEVVVFLRTAAELKAIAGHQPFDSELVEGSKGKLQVDLLHDKPSAKARREVLAMATEHDRLAFGKRELYWLPSGGTLQSELDLNAIQRLIGPTTRRTMGTMEQMAAKYFAG